MNVAVHPDEDLLDEVLRLLTISDRAIYEVQEPRLIPLDEFLECALLSAEERRNHRRIVFFPEPFACRRSRQRRPFDCDLSHI